ncbi:hypothetical protein NIES4075_27730 [Tolypothrix sp. NIES-4075]|nr:hypothetical protein NIES4075_27730 [Tolypothrix sp. NIES-4075]
MQLGNDIRLAFPKLEGLEDVFEAILQGKQNNFELNGFNINEYRFSARQNSFLSSLVDTNKEVFHQVC